MKIVIDIDEKLHRIIEQYGIACLNDVERKVLRDVISDGTPLPKGHGDLIDRDELLIESEWYGERATYSNPIPNGETAVPEEVVLNAPTIIEGSDTE